MRAEGSWKGDQGKGWQALSPGHDRQVCGQMDDLSYCGSLLSVHKLTYEADYIPSLAIGFAKGRLY